MNISTWNILLYYLQYEYLKKCTSLMKLYMEYFSHVWILWFCNSFLRELHALPTSFLIFRDNLPSYYSLRCCASQVSESEFKDLEDNKTSSTLICRRSFFSFAFFRPSKHLGCEFANFHAIHIELRKTGMLLTHIIILFAISFLLRTLF